MKKKKMKLSIVNEKTLKFGEIFTFINDVPELRLVDIINESSSNIQKTNFASGKGSFVYELNLLYDEKLVIRYGISELRIRTISSSGTTRKVFETNISLKVPLIKDEINFEPGSFAVNRSKDDKFVEQLFPISSQAHRDHKYEALFLKEPVTNNGLKAQLTSLPDAGMDWTPSPDWRNTDFQNKGNTESVDKITANNVIGKTSLRNLKNASKNDNIIYKDVTPRTNTNLISQIKTSNQPRFSAMLNGSIGRLNREIEIPKELIANSFTVSIEPILKKNNNIFLKRIKKSSFIVYHARNVKSILDPSISPTIEAISIEKCRVSLKITQNDPTSPTICVVRLVKTLLNKSDGVTFIEKNVELSHGESQIIYDFDAQNVEPNDVTYSIFLKDMPVLSHMLKIKSFKNVWSNNEPIESSNVSIIALNKSNHIEILVNNFANDIIAIKLLREDMSGLKNTEVVTGQFAEEFVDVTNSKSLILYDQSIKLNKSYRYYCILRKKHKMSSISHQFVSVDDEVIIRRSPNGNLPVNVLISAAKHVASSGGSTSVEISTSVSQKKNAIRSLVSELKAQGISDIFIDSVMGQDSLFSDISVFLVERVNKTTGHRKSLGIHYPGKFIDSSGDLAGPNKYVYIFKLLIQPVQSFFNDIYNKLISESDPGVYSQSILSKKFTGAVSNTLGVMPSTSELTSLTNPESHFLEGNTGYEKSVEIHIPFQNPVPIRLSLTVDNHSRNLLTWKASNSNTNHILSTHIFITFGGKTFLLAVIPNFKITDFKSGFKFIDEKYNDLICEKSYYVKFEYKSIRVNSDIQLSQSSNVIKSAILTSFPSGVTKNIHLNKMMINGKVEKKE